MNIKFDELLSKTDNVLQKRRVELNCFSIIEHVSKSLFFLHLRSVTLQLHAIINSTAYGL